MSHANPAKHPDDSARVEAAEVAARGSTREASRNECERLLDDALDDTFPASDPPPWTMGGSHVSQLRH
jgi:hypothetical protein